MLKKFLTLILSFIMLLSVTTACAIFIGKTFLSGPFLKSFATNVVSVSSNDSTLVEKIIGEKLNDDLKIKINEEKINEELGNLIVEFLKYSCGIEGSKKPNTSELQKRVEESIKEYEQITGKDIHDDVIEDFFNEIDRGLDNLEQNQESELKQVLQFVYSNDLYKNSIIVAIGCFIFIYLLEKNLFIALKKSGVVGVINGLGFIFLGIALKLALTNLTEDKLTLEILQKLYLLIMRVGGTSFSGSTFVLTIILFLNKNNKKEQSPIMYQKEDSINDIQYLNQQDANNFNINNINNNNNFLQ